ncbi:MAG: gliding motility-associated C-terminal domain-containing protein, partial [Flavobacteriales bacterium]|nr:gliding motility-associated C-terminal domain-containing protein [Flavobacteriales bacterium]
EAPYTVEWDGPNGFTSSDEDISDLSAGTYSVLVTDALGCLLGEVVTVNSPEELTATAIAGNPLCNGDVNGTIQLNILGGTAPYNVAWIGPDGFASSDGNISDLASGCYDYIVTDDNACETTGQVCIEAPDLLELNALITDVICFGESTGVIDAVVSGGTPGFSLTWVGPDGFTSDQSFIDNLAAGQYDVSIVDVNACQLDTFIIVGQNTQLSSNALLVPPTCFEGSNGEIDLEIDGGQAPYTFEVNGPNAYFSDIEPMFSLEAGQYIVSITDDLGCLVNDTLNLIAPDSIAIVFEQNNVQCFNQNNGSIEITETTGGNGTYSYAWTGPNGFTSEQSSISDLTPGSYTVVITDMFLCENTFEFEIEEAALLEVTLDSTVDPSCVSSLDGEINVSVVGGFAPYTFSWAGPDGFTSFDEDLSEVGEGAYNLLVTDDAGCTAELNSIVLLGQGDVTAFAPDDTTWCFGDPVVLTATSTTADAQGWRLEDGTQISDSAQVVIDFEPGTYVLTYFATDGPCEDSDEVEITIFEVVFADAGEDQSVFVEEIAVLGGDPSSDANATVYWSPGSLLADSTAFNPETLPMTADQEFILYAVSAGGCITTDTVIVNIIPEISVPDGFTPNDDGMNDTWVIGNVAFYPTTTVQVYNRWGELLYESVGYTDPWDGTYEGSLLPIGTYYYVIDVREERVNTQLTGPVTIMR